MKLVYSDAGQEKEFELKAETIRIGRSPGSDVCISDKSVSKFHATCVLVGGRYMIRDEGSSNGTFVNGIRVKESPIKPGDCLRFGNVQARVIATEVDEDRTEIRISIAGDDSDRTILDIEGASQRRQKASGSDTDRLEAIREAMKKQDKLGEMTEEAPILRIVRGGRGEYRISSASATIGSKEDNFISVKAEGVSRHHAEIFQRDGVWYIKDLGSRNGTYVNGQKIAGEKTLGGNESIHIGELELRFELAGAPAGAKAAARKEMAVTSRKRVLLAAAGAVVLLLAVSAIVAITGGDREHETAADESTGVTDKFWKLLRAGKDEFDEGDLTQARKLLTEALRVAPNKMEGVKFMEIVEIYAATKPEDFTDRELQLIRDRYSDLMLTDHPRFKEYVERKLGEVEKELKHARIIGDAIMLAGQEKWEEARKACEKIPKGSIFEHKVRRMMEEFDQKYFDHCVARAKEKEEQKDLDGAIEWYGKALSVKMREDIWNRKRLCEANKKAAVTLKEAEALFGQGRYEEALERLTGITGVYEEEAKALALRIRERKVAADSLSLYSAGKGKEALELLESEPFPGLDKLKERISRVVKAYQEGKEAFDAQDYEKANSAWDVILAWEKDETNFYYKEAVSKRMSDPRTLAEGYIARGDALYREEKYAEARKMYEKANEVDPDRQMGNAGIRRIQNRALIKYNEIINDASLSKEERVAALEGLLEMLRMTDDLYERVLERIRQLKKEN